MSDNYQYLLDKCRQYAPTGKILDYGCGDGTAIVQKGRALGLDIVGVEAFYGGSTARETAEAHGLLGTCVFPLEPDFKIPFPDQTFELIVSNQVLEHVESLELTLAEVTRVLKPGGKLLTIFPDLGVIREGHCGIPFAHRFERGSRWRYPYMRTMRQLGFGSFTQTKPPREWTLGFIEWLDKYTHYRPLTEIQREMQAQHLSLQSLEPDFVAYRLRAKGVPLPSVLENSRLWQHTATLACQKLGGNVILAEKTSPGRY